MKKLNLLFFTSFLIAGPGNYIGLELNRMWKYDGWVLDSSVLGFEMDTTIDTVFVMDTLTYLGNPAFILKKITTVVGGGSSTREDTLWEEGDFLNGELVMPWDTSISVALYKTPFQVGDTWSLGVIGTYIVELDSPPDGIMDTVYIYYDRCKILERDSLNPPLGPVTDVYKIERAIQFDLWISSTAQGGPFNGYGTDSLYEWVKPSLGTIIDSSELRVTIIVIIFPVTQVNRSYRVLSDTGRYTNMKESIAPIKNPSIVIRNREIILSFPEEEGKYSLFDVAGRLIDEYRYRGNTLEKRSLKNISRGIYFLLYQSPNEVRRWKVLLIK